MNDFGEVLERQHSFYGSTFIKQMINDGGVYLSKATGIEYKIPSHFGFCYGVEKSIDMAFETVKRFPDRRIFLTHDVIHNPKVNQDLAKKSVTVLGRDDNNQLKVDHLTDKDIVVIAAFGSKTRDVDSLKSKNCVVVDTTCGAIVVVWKRVEKYAKAGHTSIIHGIWNHEETQATASQATAMHGHYLIIRNMQDAKLVEGYLKKTVSAEDFEAHFKNKTSDGFDPKEHLQKIGIASQTTMFKSETLEIQDYLKNLYASIFGEANLKEHVMKYDTICSATQERQDAIEALLEEKKDLMIIIGGFNSSNTTHLSEIASLKYPTFHITGDNDIISKTEIKHLDPHDLEVKITQNWFESKPQKVGISTGASTPDVSIEKVINRLEEIFAL